jgi:hypothetical protein
MLYLDRYPPQIHNDESATGIAIRVFLAPNGPWALKGASFGGHPAFGFWLSSIPSKLAGVITLWNIRLAGSVMGVLSLIFMTLGIRESLGKRASLSFLLFSFPFHLHVHYSRTAFAYNHALLACGIFFWVVARFWINPSRLNATLLGIGVGVCMLVYSAAHVLPPALAGSFLAIWLLKRRYKKQSVSSVRSQLLLCGFLMLGFFMIFGAQLHEWVTHGYASRASTQMIFSPGSHKHLEASVGHRLTNSQIISQSFWHTWRFFYLEDSAGQYSFRGAPVDLMGAALAIVGLGVLCVRAIQGNMIALLSIFSATLTIAGSMLMVEANFSPHLVLFALFIPLAMAAGFDLLLQNIARAGTPLVVIVALAAGTWWTWWNYNFYQRHLETSGRGRRVWLLHLPIDTFSIRSITNFSAKSEDLGESFFELIYPGSKRANRPVSDMQEAVRITKADLNSGYCPCLLVVQNELSTSFADKLNLEGIDFRELRGTFRNWDLDSSAFIVK